MCAQIAFTPVYAVHEPAYDRHDQGSDSTPHPPHSGTPPVRPGRDPWWMRHIRALVGGSLVLAAVIVLIWPGSLLALGFGALGVGMLVLACAALILCLAARRSIRSPDTRD